MMTKEQYLLAKLAEECAEVAQMAIKCQHFGLYEQQNVETPYNIHRLHEEINDFLGVLELMNDEIDFNFDGDYAAAKAKMQKVKKYAEYSKSLGLVDWS